MSSPGLTRSWPERFLVAFSLAGENRDVVRPVAEAVEKALGPSSVLYDEWYEHEITGLDGDLLLQGIYSGRCSVAVVCVSGAYGGKPWTKIEHRAVRDRYAKAQDETGRRGILLLRVGAGDVPGIFSIDIAKDIRKIPVEAAAQLIIDRLRLIVPDAGIAATPGPDWPEAPPEINWPMADHAEVREAFARLLCRATPHRFLPVEGPSEVGKTTITRQMLRAGLETPDLACGRFDFKGTTNLDNEVRAFVQHLDIDEPPANLQLSSRLGQILHALKQKGRPTLLVFESYELAREAEDWVENQLLPSLIRNAWLRVVVAGQRTPKANGATWEGVSFSTVPLRIPGPEDWYAFGKDHKPEIKLEFLRDAHRFCSGKASVLAELCGPAR